MRENKSFFILICEELHEDSQKINNICRIVTEVAEVPSRIKQDPRKCFILGDILIALDVPEDFILVSEDNHFYIICDVLNIPFWRI